jgi:hypothetical protein
LDPSWQAKFFRGVALDFWRLVATPEQTRAEAEFLQKALNTEDFSHLLDVPKTKD